MPKVALPTRPWEYGILLVNDLCAPAISRSTTTGILTYRDLPHLRDDANLLTNELVTCAVKFGRGRVYVRYRWNGDTLRICVRDPLPAQEDAAPLLVRRMARRWGCHELEHARAVWFEL